MSKYIIHRCKRDEYIKAWNNMYKSNKKGFNDSLYDGINPSLNKIALKTEVDNFCTVAYDTSIKDDEFSLGKPVGIFCFVVTKNKIIGKQYVVDPNYLRQGIGKALLIEAEKMLIENGYEWYYIGCSHCSAGIYKKYWNITPYQSDELHDLYKFNVNLKRENFNELYYKIMQNFSVEEN